MEKIRFDTSFVGVDKERRARHGMPWTSYEYDRLKDLFQKGSSLKTMCEAMQRPAEGVLAKLISCGHIVPDTDHYNRYNYAPASKVAFDDCHESTPVKEVTMTKNLIESKVFVNGTDATDMSDAEIFRLIAKTEDEISKLKAIKTPSKKLSDAISKLEADVIKLAEYVDSRD